MKKIYNYIVYPQTNIKFDFDMPMSSQRSGTINSAYVWAELLMKFNENADYVLFMSQGGWKVYSVRRVNGKLVRR